MTGFDISDHLDTLVAGPNVLAIHGLNDTTTSPDFLIATGLTGDVTVTLTGEQAYFTTPTPAADNLSGTLGLVGDTRFSVDRGFYDTPFALEITTDTQGAEIRYTTNGSEPTATTGTVYSGPISISGQTVLRAAAFKPGYEPSNIDTQTYIFIDDVLIQPDVPAGYPASWPGDSSTRPGDYGMDPEVVNDPRYAGLMESSLKSIPTISIVTDKDNLFNTSTGIYIKATRPRVTDDPMDYEVPASVEYFNADGAEEFQIDCGLRMRGGASRKQRVTPKHSFRLIFRGMYGAGKLNYPIFGDDATDSFDTIILRAGSNLSWPHHNGWPLYSENRIYAQYVRDQWGKDIQKAMGWPTCSNNSAHLYLNGIYWGLYNPGERPSAPFAATYLGGEKEDYDVINSGECIDGNMTAWNTMISLGLSGVANSTSYQQMAEMLDVEAFADYMIINQYGGNFDWDHHNWHAYRNRVAGGKWYFAVWDYEILFVRLHDNRIDPTQFGQFEPSSDYKSYENILTRLWLQLMQNAEFKTMFADRVHKHLFNDGLLTPDNVIAHWNVRSDDVYEAVLGESARWGDYRRDVFYAGRPSFDDHRLYDRDEEWVNERNRLINDYFPYRTDVVIQQYMDVDAYPSLEAPVFSVNGEDQHGGPFDPGDALTISATAGGVITYTLDGTDPRDAGGGFSASAEFFTDTPIALTRDTVAKARFWSDSRWSALTEAVYRTVAAPTLAITEINYNPAAPTVDEVNAGYLDGDAFEFIELLNTGAATLDIRTVEFADGVVFSFADSAVAMLAPGEYVLLVSDPAAFEYRYGTGLPIAGAFTGALNNAGETIAVTRGGGIEFIRFTYNDSGPWPGRADGKGATLERIDTAADPTDSESWRSSAEYLGTPGEAGSGLTGEVVVNEVLSHTDGEPTDSIELYNTTDDDIDIGGWYLSDTSQQYAKFRIPDGTTIDADAYLVFDEHDFNPGGLTVGDPSDDDPNDFALSGAYGDDVWLMAADAAGVIERFVDHVEFAAAANGESYGRWPDGVGDLLPMSAVTLGYPNVGPRAGSVIISEIMYNPGGWTGLPTVPIMVATFDADAEGFAYEDNLFGTANPAAIDGAWSAGRLGVTMNFGVAGGVSGGWTTAIEAPGDGVVEIAVSFDLFMLGDWDEAAFTEVVLVIDGVPYGDDLNSSLLHVAGDGSGPPTGLVTATVAIPLDAGMHALTVGLYNSDDNPSLGNFIALRFDQIEVRAVPDLDDLEFVELYNATAGAVDLTGWLLDKAVDFMFDDGTILPSGRRLVALSFNPANVDNADRVTFFRDAFGIDASVALVGGWGGRLNNAGERLQLLRPDAPPAEDPTFIPYLLEDEVDYGSLDPWPTTPDGEGDSLHRYASAPWGDDPASWFAAAPSPGTGEDVVLLPGDANGDGAVDLEDFVILKTNFGTTGATLAQGDFNGDGDVDLDDFVILKANFGRTAGSAN